MAKTLEDQGRALPKNSAKTPMTRVAPAKIEVEILPDEAGDDAIPVLDLEPYIDPKSKAVTIKGNYDTIEAFLTKRLKVVETQKFSAKDMDTVMKYKKEFQGYRTMFSAAETTGKRVWFNAPKDVYVGKIATLIALAVKGEDKTDKVIAIEEQKRVNDLNKVFSIYKDDFQAVYCLSKAGFDSIEYRLAYYNKTAKEKETKADLEQQFKDIKQKEKARTSGEKMIRAACSGNKLLDTERYIGMLDTDELANIIDLIEAEKVRLETAKKDDSGDVGDEGQDHESYVPGAGASSSSASEPVMLGVLGSVGESLKEPSDFPGKTKVMVVDIEYPVDKGDALSALFKELYKYGIKTKTHKESVF